jgi:hypothetical protein
MNEKFEPVGLIEISRQIKSSLKKVGERRQFDPAKIEEAMKRNETVWKAGYDVGYTEGFKAGSITSTEPARWNGDVFEVNYDDVNESTSVQRDRDLLESHGINVNKLYANVKKMIEDHEAGYSDKDEMVEKLSGLDYIVDDDTDEDEPDQYPDNYGGTK